MKWERSDSHFWNSGSTCTPRVYHRMFFHSSSNELRTKLLVENDITKWGAPYGFCRFRIWIMGYQFWRVPYWLWSFPEPLQSSKATSYKLFCSSTNFVYSNHVGVMPWAHNSSAGAKPSGFWPQNVEPRERQPHKGVYLHIRWRLSTLDIVVFHLDTMALVLYELIPYKFHGAPCCLKKIDSIDLWRTLGSESSIHSYPVSRVKSHPQFPHLATTLVNHTCLVDHSNPPIVKQIVTCRTPNPTFRTVVRQHLLFLGKSEETLEPGFLPKFIHRSQISINGC